MRSLRVFTLSPVSVVSPHHVCLHPTCLLRLLTIFSFKREPLHCESYFTRAQDHLLYGKEDDAQLSFMYALYSVNYILGLREAQKRGTRHILSLRKAQAIFDSDRWLHPVFCLTICVWVGGEASVRARQVLQRRQGSPLQGDTRDGHQTPTVGKADRCKPGDWGATA